MKITELWKAVGGLGTASKMPWFTYGLPASKCKVGSSLRKLPGTVCSMCYAYKGLYRLTNVQKAQLRRWEIVTNHEWNWALDMMELLNRKAKGQVKYFRWFDSGDLQSVTHLKAIIGIACALPNIQFWLPTREISFLVMLNHVTMPDNLTIRLSASKIGRTITSDRWNTSSVGADKGYLCPASRGEVTCDGAKCRACWDKTVVNVDYAAH